MSVLEERVWQQLREVYDPEIPVNIVDLGLIYEVKEFPVDAVYIRMTVTSAHCPAAAFLPVQVEEAAKKAPGVKNVIVELVDDPAWTRSRMSANAKKILGYTS